MANQSLEFTLTAKDQASQVLNSVQKKVESFGKDVGKSIAGVVGPMAAVTWAVGKVTEHFEEMAKKAKEALDWGSTLSDNADKMGVTVEEFQRITAAAEATNQSVDKVGQAFRLAADLIAQAKAGNKDAIASLQALGISVDDLDKTNPQDVLAKLAGALAAATNPADKMAIAMAALGKSAKDLQDVLAKGFDIQGAMMGTQGLISDEEAALLNEAARREKQKELRAKVSAAKQAARDEFLSTPEGQDFARRNTKYYGAMQGTASVGPTNEQIDAELARVQKQKQAESDAANIAAGNVPNPAAASALIGIAEANAAKEAAKAKEPKGSKIGGVSNEELGSVSVKTPPLTVSSLREIGGGIAGETVMSTIDLAQVQVDLQKSMLKELETLNNRSRDTIDFTKFPPLNGLAPNRTLV